MSTSDDKIALQSSKVLRSRQELRQKRVALSNGALGLCKRPATLFTALVAGAVSARVYPLFLENTHRAHVEDRKPPVVSRIITTLLFSLATSWVKQVFNPETPASGDASS